MLKIVGWAICGFLDFNLDFKGKMFIGGGHRDLYKLKVVYADWPEPHFFLHN